MNVLITGITSLLGLGLLATKPENTYIIGTFFKNSKSNVLKKVPSKKLDVTDKKSITSIFEEIKPDVLIHSSAMSNVDDCEKHKKEAYIMNVQSIKYLIPICKKHRCTFIFPSTNAVFDGLHPPYDEKSIHSPVNYYGKTKAIGEELMKKSGIDSTIVRMVLMYGWNEKQERQNAVTWLLGLLEKGSQVPLVNDTYTNPLYNIEAGKAIWNIIKKKKSSIYHIAGKTRVNRYEFGVLTAKVFNYNPKRLTAVTSDYFKGIARRMPDTTYDTSLMESELHMRPLSLSRGLMHMLHNKQ